jgi:hypothetical protein
MSTAWRPLPEVARASGVPESTARRYARGVALPYLPTQAAGRYLLFDQAVAVPILRRVAELYHRGRTQDQEVEILAREFMPIMELEAPDAVVAVERHQPPRDPDGGWPAVLRELLTAHNALRAELAEERQARAALEDKLRVLEAELIQGKRRQREFERAVEGRLKPTE